MNKLLSVLMLVLPLLAGAQEVWRCGPDGRVYANAPCADGRRVDVAQAERPAADVQAARAQAARDENRADALRRERLAQERAQRGTGAAAGIGPQASARPPALKSGAKAARGKQRSKQGQAQSAEDGTSRAVAPASRRTKG